MKKYIQPNIDIIEVDTEGIFLLASSPKSVSLYDYEEENEQM